MDINFDKTIDDGTDCEANPTESPGGDEAGSQSLGKQVDNFFGEML